MSVFLVLKKFSWVLVLGSLLVGIPTAIINCFLPAEFESRAVIMPKMTKSASSLDTLFGQVHSLSGGGIGSLLGGATVAGTELLQFQQVIRSRASFERIFQKNLPLLSRVFKKELNEVNLDLVVGAMNQILKNTELKVEGPVLVIQYKNEDPKLAQEVLLAVIQSLQDFLNTNITTQSRGAEAFVKNRLDEVIKTMDQTEDKLTHLRMGDRTYASAGRSIQSEVSRTDREFMRLIKMIELLSQQYELSQIEAKRDDPMFATIEPPTLATYPAGPHRVLNTLIGFILGLALSTLSILWCYRLNVLRV